MKLPNITPGVWQITQLHGFAHNVLLSRQPDSSVLIIANIVPERSADAKAIAALPDLLDALNKARITFSQLSMSTQAEKCVVALRKAGATDE